MFLRADSNSWPERSPASRAKSREFESAAIAANFPACNAFASRFGRLPLLEGAALSTPILRFTTARDPPVKNVHPCGKIVICLPRSSRLSARTAVNIHEYQARELLQRFGVATTRGKVASTPTEAERIAA